MGEIEMQSLQDNNVWELVLPRIGKWLGVNGYLK